MRRIAIALMLLVPLALGAGALAAAAGFPHFLRSWGSHGSGPGMFAAPDQVAVDNQGHVYVADRKNDRVEEFDYAGRLVRVLGSAGTAAGQFEGPRGVTIDRFGHIYVADTGNNRIEKFDAQGNVLAVWGRNGGDGTAGRRRGQFSSPRGLATNRAGDLYVADHGNNRIQELSPDGHVLVVFGRHGGDGSAGNGRGQFRAPRGVAVDRSGDVYVADKLNNRIQKFSPRGRFLLMWGRHHANGSRGRGNGQFHIPYSVAIGPGGQVFVADTGNNRLQEFTPAGHFLRRLGRHGGNGSAGSAPGQFSTPYGIAVDCRGNVFVSDEGNSRVQMFGSPGAPPPPCAG